MRIGVLGCGVIAYWAHLRVLRRMPGATLEAAADPDPAARASARRLTGVPMHERAEDLLRRSDIDVVVICAPTQCHADLAVAAAGAGKHFYLEKPIATDAAGAKRVVDAAAAAGVIGRSASIAGFIHFTSRRETFSLPAASDRCAGCDGALRA